jgi:hypothetical protein
MKKKTKKTRFHHTQFVLHFLCDEWHDLDRQDEVLEVLMLCLHHTACRAGHQKTRNKEQQKEEEVNT